MIRTTIALISALLIGSVHADQTAPKTIADVYQDKAALAGQPVTIHGKVVKVNNSIMNRNWLHLQDGSGDAAAGTNDIAVTSDATAAMGDEITITGTVAVDLDFGAGYKYPLLIEKATIVEDQ
jgi:hypothetical protein